MEYTTWYFENIKVYIQLEIQQIKMSFYETLYLSNIGMHV